MVLHGPAARTGKFVSNSMLLALAFDFITAASKNEAFIHHIAR